MFGEKNTTTVVAEAELSALDQISATASNSAINYVSLGDSIAVGYLLNGHNKSEEPKHNSSNNTYSAGKFIDGSYSNWFKSMLASNFGASTVNAVTYAKSGDKVSDLLDKLDATNVRAAVAGADVVTICIGANDILGPATENIWEFIKAEPSITIQQMDLFLDNGLNELQGSDGTFVQLLNKLHSINTTAKFIFTSVYNPYKYLGVAMNDPIEEAVIPYILNVDNVDKIRTETEIYLSGGTNSSGNIVKGLNQILTERIYTWNEAGHTNYTIVDTKTEFDKCSQSQYSNLVNCWLTPEYSLREKCEQSNIDINWNQVATDLALGGSFPSQYIDAISELIASSVDPHPSLGGHNILAAQFANAIGSTKFNTAGGGNVKDQIILKNQPISRPANPRKDGSIFGGWYKDSACQNLWNFATDVITNDQSTLYAKWTNLTCANEDLLTQNSSSPRPVVFNIDVQDTVSWYVNNVKQSGNSTTFTYTPTSAGTTSVYCEVDGVKSKSYTINTLTEDFKLEFTASNDGTNDFTFETSNLPTNVNESDIVWRYSVSGANKWSTLKEGTKTFTQYIKFPYDVCVGIKNGSDLLYLSDTVTIYPEYTVQFIDVDNNQETIVSTQIVDRQIVTRPENPIKSGYIFGGWYSEDTFQNLWNFSTSQVTGEDSFIIDGYIKKLYAKWVNVECIKFGDMQVGDEDFDNNQHFQDIDEHKFVDILVNTSNPIVFKINVQYGDAVSWYVDNKLVEGQTNNTFAYTPNTVGIHYVYCMVDANGTSSVKSIVFQCPVIYYTPAEINIVSERVDRTTYILSVSHPYLSSIDVSKFVWKIGDAVIAGSEGQWQIQHTIEQDCEIYAVYQIDDNAYIQSNNVELSTKENLMNIPLILGIAGASLLGIGIFIFIRKRYIKYKNRKNATFYTWHKW